MKDLIRLSRILKKIDPSSISFTQNGDRYKEFELSPFKVKILLKHVNHDWLEVEVYSGIIQIDGFATPLDGSLVHGYKDYLSEEEISTLSSNSSKFKNPAFVLDFFCLIKQFSFYIVIQRLYFIYRTILSVFYFF